MQIQTLISAVAIVLASALYFILEKTRRDVNKAYRDLEELKSEIAQSKIKEMLQGVKTDADKKRKKYEEIARLRRLNGYADPDDNSGAGTNS